MRRAAWLVAGLVLAAVPAARSGASFTATSVNPNSTFAAASPYDYAHFESQSTDSAGGTGYATRLGATPATPAATGGDATLTVDMGTWPRNTNSTTVMQVFTIKPPSPLPGGLTQMTASAQVLSAAGCTTGAIAVPAPGTATLKPGTRLAVPLVVNTRVLANRATTTCTLRITLTWTGYTGTFVAADVPVRLTNA